MSWLSQSLQAMKRLFSGGGAQKRTIHLREGTAEFELFVVKGELELRRDLVHGMHHLGNLLAFDPRRRDWLDLLEAYLDAAGSDPLSLLPEKEERYYAEEALRAYVFARQGRLNEAIELLNAVVMAKPDAEYMEAWGLDWLEKPGSFESLPEQEALCVLVGALNRFSEHRFLTARRRRDLLRYTKLAERYARHFSRNEISDMTHVGLLRKAGLLEEALGWARDAQPARPGWNLAMAEGLVLREMGQCEAAEAAFQRGLQADPEDLSALLETADMYFHLDRWETALRWYEEVLERNAEHDWAYPSALFCRWKLQSDAAFPDETFPHQLIELAQTDPPSQRAQELCSRFSMYVGYLPEPVDATANIIRQVTENLRQSPPDSGGGGMTITLSHLEAPSNALAFHLQMQAFDYDAGLEITVERIPKPDPRKPVEPVEFLLWEYDGTDASPALAPPPDDVARRIAEVASEPYDWRANWAHASRIAEELAPSRVAEVLAVMVHPPAVPDGRSALEWLPRVQLAAAQVVAHLDDGWEDSVRRRALYSVLLGPRDWTTVAAIVVLVQLVTEYEVISPDVHDQFTRLANARPRHGYCCYEHALYSNWLALPHLFPKERESIEKVLRRLQEDEG